MRGAEKGVTVDESVILYTTWPDEQTAEAFAALAVAERLAACANILAPLRSVYRWEGAVEQAVEIPILLKTTKAAAPALRDLILDRHPHEAPCVLALAIEPTASSPAFLDWIGSQVLGPATTQS